MSCFNDGEEKKWKEKRKGENRKDKRKERTKYQIFGNFFVVVFLNLDHNWIYWG